jgi:RNA polymerase sigma-70 factor, ECF subfamily
MVASSMGPDQQDPEGPPVSPIEHAIREHLAADRGLAAVTLAIGSYGEELFGFMLAFARNDADADDLFSELCERLWSKLPQFGQRSSFRTWSYAIARNLVRDESRARERRRGRDVALSDAPEIHKLAQDVRTTTVQHLRSDAKARLEELRAALEPDDRTLLILSVDRHMGWREIAEVMSDGEPDDKELARISARLRKRFERIKARLRDQVLAKRARES